MPEPLDPGAAGTRVPPHAARPIDDPRHPVARRVADVLRSRSAAPRVFVIDDAESIAQAVRCGIRIDSLYVVEGPTVEAVPAAAARGAPVHVLSPGVVEHLFGSGKRARVFALARAPRRARLADLTDRPGDVVVLDSVRIVGNIGAIARSACALGAAGLVLVDSGLRSALDRRLVRASRGLVFAIPVVLATRHEFGRYARAAGLPVAALTAEGAEPLRAVGAVRGRIALALGGERHGVSAAVTELAARRYAIPMADEVESLNVSVAAGIALYERRAGAARVSDEAH